MIDLRYPWSYLVPMLYPQIPEGLDVLTTSSRAQAQSCLRLYFYRNVLEIVPLASDARALNFGSVIHSALEMWYRSMPRGGQPQDTQAFVDAKLGERLLEIEKLIGLAYANRSDDQIQKENWHYAIAMMRAYVCRYPWEEFEIEAIEQPAWGELRNPKTNRRARGMVYALRADGVVRKPDSTLWLLEHKTASSITGAYLERLWSDNQIITYVMYLERYYGVKIQGVIYNVLAKPKLVQTQGETEEQYQARYAEACATSKNGKSSAKRRMPETDDEFQSRLARWFDKPDSFHREEILVYDNQTTEIREELWNTVEMLKWCRKTGRWPRNRNNCYAYNRRCGYWEVCAASAEDFEGAIELYMQKQAAHTELGTLLNNQSATSDEE